jgi:heme/copper-type cytochrome/quinol oxidase subunit 2
MKRTVAVLLVTALIILSFVIFFLELGSGATKKTLFQSFIDNHVQSSTSATNPENTPRIVELTVKNWEFDPPTIIVKKDQTFILRAKSVDVAHSFAIKDLGIQADLLPFKAQDIPVHAKNEGRFVLECTKNCGPIGYSQMRGLVVVK